MSDPTSTPASGSPGGPPIKIPAAGGPPNPKKQTVRISVPPTPAQQPPQASNPSPTSGTTAGPTPSTRPQARHHLTPSRMERFRSFLMSYKWIITIILCVIGAGVAWLSYPKEKSLTSATVEVQIRDERDELRKQVRLQEIERIRLTNEIELLQKGFDQMTDVIMSNQLASAKSPKTNTPWVSKPTNHPVTQTEPPKNVGSGLVTVNENHGDIKIIIKSSDGERSVRTSSGPDKAEDIIPGLAEATGTESPIITDKMISSQGNGIRYYLPKGWSMSFTYFGSENDFEVFINKGTREVTRWEAIDVSSDGISESIWIKSRRNIRFRFTLTPAK